MNIKLNQEDLNTLHDIIFNALDKWDLTNEQLMEYWEKIPVDIKIDVLKWGISDTVVRENIYLWLKNNFT